MGDKIAYQLRAELYKSAYLRKEEKTKQNNL